MFPENGAKTRLHFWDFGLKRIFGAIFEYVPGNVVAKDSME